MTHAYYRVDGSGVQEIHFNDVAREVRIACTLARMSQGEFATAGSVEVTDPQRGTYAIKRDDTLSLSERFAAGLVSAEELEALTVPEVVPDPLPSPPSGEPVFDAEAELLKAREAQFGPSPSGIKGEDERG